MKEELTSKRITTILHRHFYNGSELIIPRYTPLDWWECDLWRLTKAGMVDEYEIKMSVSDFKADARKEGHQKWLGLDEVTQKCLYAPGDNKHALLATDQRGPNRFWFVMPEAIADAVTVPPFAGLIAIQNLGGVSVRARAPKRHSRKWEGNKLKLLQNFYHRYWHHETVKVETAEPICEPDNEEKGADGL